METKKRLNIPKPDPASAVDAMNGDIEDQLYAPRHLSFAENVQLTIKVLVIVGLSVALIAGLNHWIIAQ